MNEAARAFVLTVQAALLWGVACIAALSDAPAMLTAVCAIAAATVFAFAVIMAVSGPPQ